MNLSDLLAETQANFVGDPEMSVSESIYYTHSIQGELGGIFAFPEMGDYNAKEKEKTLNEIKFSNVILKTLDNDENPIYHEPTKNDTIIYDNKVWSVRWWQKSSNMYTIIADNKKRNKVSSRSFK